MVCAGVHEGGAGICGGDSGGPLQCPIQEGIGAVRWYLWGTTSWSSICGMAAAQGVFARTTQYLDWIKENTGITF